MITKQAVTWINEQETAYARTLREKAKFLVSRIGPREMPHPSIWNQVGLIAAGLSDPTE